MRNLMLAAVATVSVMPVAVSAQDASQSAITSRIIDEGANHSQVMPTVQHLTDVIGPRMTNSPAMRVAEKWTADKFAAFGLKNIHKEGFLFGRGWTIERSSARMMTPRIVQLTAIPIAWTPATKGVVTAPIIVAPISKEADFAKYRGQLRGKIVLISKPGTGDEPTDPVFERMTGADLAKADAFQQPRYDPAAIASNLKWEGYDKKLDAFLAAEGAVAYATRSYRDGKLVAGEGNLFGTDETGMVPGVEIAAEDYRRLARLAKSGAAPMLEINNDVRFDDSDPNAYNIIAEIPGTDPKAGYVMAGAHFDSWAAADGAADNAAGTAMVMEAARILVATGARPKRTIRFALWSGEEQGIFGSLAYVQQHLATRGDAETSAVPAVKAASGWSRRYPVKPLSEYQALSAYFNIDNGSGKLRGIYAENNLAAIPILDDWLSPFSAMGASTVVARGSGGTDHVRFQSVGIPGFQFIQDGLDYDSRVHHSSVDTFDHLKADDMRQGSIVLASVLLSAANADKPLPRKPMPTQPVVTDPFAYPSNDD